MRGVAVTVSHPIFDSDGEISGYTPETVQNVLIDPIITKDAQDGTRPYATDNILTFHFPKGYTASLRGCRIAYDGHVYEADGDPQPYMATLTPGPRNRPVQAKEVLG